MNEYEIRYQTGDNRHNAQVRLAKVQALGIIDATQRAVRIAARDNGVVVSVGLATLPIS